MMQRVFTFGKGRSEGNKGMKSLVCNHYHYTNYQTVLYTSISLIKNVDVIVGR